MGVAPGDLFHNFHPWRKCPPTLPHLPPPHEYLIRDEKRASPEPGRCLLPPEFPGSSGTVSANAPPNGGENLPVVPIHSGRGKHSRGNLRGQARFPGGGPRANECRPQQTMRRGCLPADHAPSPTPKLRCRLRRWGKTYFLPPAIAEPENNSNSRFHRSRVNRFFFFTIPDLH